MIFCLHNPISDFSCPPPPPSFSIIYFCLLTPLFSLYNPYPHSPQATYKHMLETLLDESGYEVDYAQLRDDVDGVLTSWTAAVSGLRALDLTALSPSVKTALLINVYNGLTIHAIGVHKRRLMSVLQCVDFWRSTAYNIGGEVFTLDDIEHGILRGNQTHPADGHLVFNVGDSRLRHTLETCDARIHFALNCGARSCPPLRVWRAEGLEAQMAKATADYLSSVTVSKGGTVTLPKLFRWYGSDFSGGTPTAIVQYILPYLNDDVRTSAQKLLQRVSDGNGSIRVSYRSYNWELNGTN